jgi:hypothetical protein
MDTDIWPQMSKSIELYPSFIDVNQARKKSMKSPTGVPDHHL